MSEINVVPYVDVMLVLLVIFMVTAPMLMQGVQVNLPQADADPVDKQDSEPLIVSINSVGHLYLNLGREEQILTLSTVKQRVSAIMRRNPDKPILVWGRQDVSLRECCDFDGSLTRIWRSKCWSCGQKIQNDD